MKRVRVQLVVEIDLDPVPGWGHNPDDWQKHLQGYLNSIASHYSPVVTLSAGEQS